MTKARQTAPGPAEHAVEKAIRVAIDSGRMDDTLDAPLVAALRVIAAGLDRLDAAANPIGAQRLSRELRALTHILRLTPATRDAGHDALADFLASLSVPETAASSSPTA